MGETDLPAGFTWESRDLHAMWGTSRTRSRTLSGGKGITVASTARKLNGQTLSHEVGAVECWYDVPRV